MGLFRLFKAFGRPVYFHWSVILVFLYFALKHKGIDIAIGAVSYLLLLLIHELGHAYYVTKLGYKLQCISIYPVYGACSYHYDPRYPVHPLVDAGGLLFQLVLLVVWLAVLGVVKTFAGPQYITMLMPATHAFVFLNIVIIILNALPIPGLDGYSLWGKLNKAIKSNRKTSVAKAKPLKIQDPKIVVDMAIERAKRQVR